MLRGFSGALPKTRIPTVFRLIQSVSLRSRAIPPASVGSTQLKTGAIGSSIYLGASVVTTQKIGVGMVTPARSSPMLRSHIWLGDETLVSGTPTTFAGTRKDFKIIRSGTAGVNYGSIRMIYELRRPPGSAGSVRMRIMLQGSQAFLSPYVNSGTYSLRSGSMRISQLTIGSPIPGALQVRTSATTASAQQRLLELYGQMTATD